MIVRLRRQTDHSGGIIPPPFPPFRHRFLRTQRSRSALITAKRRNPVGQIPKIDPPVARGEIIWARPGFRRMISTRADWGHRYHPKYKNKRPYRRPLLLCVSSRYTYDIPPSRTNRSRGQRANRPRGRKVIGVTCDSPGPAFEEDLRQPAARGHRWKGSPQTFIIGAVVKGHTTSAFEGYRRVAKEVQPSPRSMLADPLLLLVVAKLPESQVTIPIVSRDLTA